ncbi:unnamed protein product, partial [Mesorhabditis spiculigera]
MSSSGGSKNKFKRERAQMRADTKALFDDIKGPLLQGLGLALRKPVTKNEAAEWVHHDLDKFNRAFLKLFAPSFFSGLRAKQGIDEAAFCASMSNEQWTSDGTRGNSGSVLFSTADRHFFIKSISKREYELYEKIWPKLKEKMMSGTSFLPPVVCLFVENTHDNIGYLVMKNLFLGISGPAFDLKGRKRTMAAGMTTGRDDEFVADFPGGIILEKRDRDQLLSKLQADIKIFVFVDVILYMGLILLAVICK